MGTARNLKYEIISMRNDGLSYRQIEKELQCSKGTINYHCKKSDMVDTGKKLYPLSKELKKQILEFCKTNPNKVAMKHFNLSLSSIKKYKKIQE